MNCSEFQDCLQQRLDGDTSADGVEIERHVAGCQSCRELQSAAMRLIRALETQAAAAPPDRMSDQLVSLLLDEAALQNQARKLWSRRLIGTAAVAACLLVAIALGRAWWRTRPGPSPPSADALVKKEEKSIPQQTGPSINIRDAGGTLVALVNRTADETVGQGRVLLPQTISAPTLQVPQDWQSSLDPETQSLRQAQEGVVTGFEPVTGSARRAVNLFLREITPMETQKQ
jgi:hypothetical protein